MVNYFKATPKNNIIGKELTIAINRLDINGCGVGQHQGKSVFVDGALPQEKVKIKVIEQKNKYLRAKLLNVVDASHIRLDPLCEHFSVCGGCDLQHINAQEQIKFKHQKVSDLFNRHQIAVDLPWQDAITGETEHYRRKARIGVQYNKRGEATVGFRQKGSNQLTAIKRCSVLVETLSDIFSPLKSVLSALSGKNSVGHVEVIQTDSTTLIVRQLVALTSQDELLWQHFSAQYHCEILIDDGKNIFPLVDTEAKTLAYNINNKISLTFSPDDFIQINHNVNKKMVAQAINWLELSPEDNVLDLFCGLGNFSLPIANKVQSVTGVEGVDKMVNQATKNATLNQMINTQFFQADLNSSWKQHAWSEQHYTKVLLDPARAGAYEAIVQLVTMKIPTLLYVSCDPTTLAKDTALLVSNGYKIKKIGLIDMFSHTKHIETMVLFSL